MAKVSVTVEVSKELYELGQGLSKVVASVKQALADGWQPGQDLPTIAMAAYADLVPAVQGLDKAGAELAEDRSAALRAVSLGLSDVVDSVLPKQAA